MKTREEVIKEVIENLKSIEVDGETMQHILEETAMDAQMHRQLVLSFPKEQTELLLEELAELNGEFSSVKIQKDRDIIIAAVSEDLYELITKEHSVWLDNHGHYAFYDLVVTLVDEMMLTEGSTYRKYMKAKSFDNKLDWSTFTNECFDWFHMGLARKLVTEELLLAVCYGETNKYFEKVRKKFYELGIDEGEELGTRTLKTFDTKEEAEAFKAELEGMFPKMKLFIDTCTYDYVATKN